MSGQADKQTVGQLRAYYQSEIENRKREIADFEGKLRLLETLRADAEILAQSKDKYHGWTLTPAVMDSVGELWKSGPENPNGVEAYDVYLYLCQYGFEGPQNLAVAVHTTLKRLAADGRLETVQDKYLKRFYKPGGKISGTGAGVSNAHH
jgi:hypothetical protein